VESFRQLARREVLLPLGVSLCFLGIILRGFARSARRAAALRHQDWLHSRRPGEAEPAGRHGGWFEKNLPRIANCTALAGIFITLLAFFRE
jgi:hypothetical protein